MLIRRSLGGVVATLLAIELLDELVFGAREAAWPAVRDDLSLSYAEIGLLLTVPSLVSLAVEPVLGVVAVTRHRRLLVLGGGASFALALALAAGAPSFWVLLVAFALLYPASGAFVSLSQAALMDLQPGQREHNMARWNFAGSVGAVAGPLLLALFAWTGLGWRGLFAGFALLAVALVALAVRAPDHVDGERPRVREALRMLTRREVFRWLFLLELSDLLLDVFLAFLALYLVDEADASIAAAGLAVAVWTGAALVGSALIIPLLKRVEGLRYLRASAMLTIPLFAAFLVVPGLVAKLFLVGALGLVNAGWYPVLKARLYGALGEASALVLTVGALFPLNAVLPLAIAALAERLGLAAALWPLLAAPVALLLLVPRRRL
ncbi:MAG TPA: MFS transporter [Gaiellaceae bacterium]|nr:MFS transporter [Gaiellaceae bacterium]